MVAVVTSRVPILVKCIVCAVPLWRKPDNMRRCKSGPFCTARCASSRSKKTLLDRFNASWIGEPMSGCWLWLRSVNSDGYGSIGGENRDVIGAHRVSWKLFKGAVPDGMCVCHRCDNPSCVNPDHLFLGTQTDNIDDMISKNRFRTVPSVGTANCHAKMTDDIVREIRASTERTTVLARRYGVTRHALYLARTSKTWKHIP